MYCVIEDVILTAIPLWDLSLAPHATFRPRARRIAYKEVIYDPDPEQEVFPPEPEDHEDEGEDEFEPRVDAYWDWVKETRKVVLPEPAKFTPLPAPDKFSLKDKFGRLEIIVKLANIELTPEKPDYAGGS